MDWQLTGDQVGEGECEMNGSARTRYRMPGKPCPFRPCRDELDFLQLGSTDLSRPKPSLPGVSGVTRDVYSCFLNVNTLPCYYANKLRVSKNHRCKRWLTIG